jgi:hypothetical protein
METLVFDASRQILPHYPRYVPMAFQPEERAGAGGEDMTGLTRQSGASTGE